MNTNYTCPCCDNVYTDAQIESGEITHCIRCAKCYDGDCGLTCCYCFDDEYQQECGEGYCSICEEACHLCYRIIDGEPDDTAPMCKYCLEKLEEDAAPKILDSHTDAPSEIAPKSPITEVSPDHQKIDAFFQEGAERQNYNKTLNTSKMNTMTELEQIESYFKVDFNKMSNAQLKNYIITISPEKVSLSGFTKSRLQHYIFVLMRSETAGFDKLNNPVEALPAINPDDLDLIIIKGGAPEPIPIVKIQPVVEQTPIEKPILRDSKYDAVIAEINAGVCSIDNAIRMNKYRLIVHTYIGTTGIQDSYLKMVGRFGCCPHDSGKKNTYMVGNIFGETKLQLTPDGQIIYDRTYFKGKDKQKYFATRWFERPESSGWDNSYIDENRGRGCHRSGVEVFGMRGGHLTKDGKFKYEGVSIAHLKEACKKNGIKGFSGKDKHELVKLLMKV